MENELTILITNFRNYSSRVFQFLYNDFKAHVKKLDRQKDENVFQQLQGRYSNELESQLKRAAEKMINEYKGHESATKLQRELTSQINYNLSEFHVKIRSM